MAYSKYSAKPTFVDGIRFASAAESRRYSELKCLQQAKIIEKLDRQPRFALYVEGDLVTTYVADFAYYENGKRVIEDVKGFKTDEYKIKRKLLLALNKDLDHREITMPSKRKGRAEITQEVKELFRDANRRRA
jgi:hypothetical protein